MNTITETRPQDKQTSGMEAVGGIAAAERPAKGLGQFGLALSTWIARRDAVNAMPMNTTAEHEAELCDLLTAAERKLTQLPINTASDLRALAEVIWGDAHSLPSPDLLAAMFTGLRKLDSAGASRTFNAATWLQYYEQRGGGWVETDGEITLVQPVEATDGLKDLQWELDTRDGLEAVKAEIRARIIRYEEPDPTWGQLMSAFQTADARLAEHGKAKPHPAGSPENDAAEVKTDRLVDEASEALIALFRSPSPNVAAYQTKTRLYAEQALYGWNEAHEFSQIIAEEAKLFTS